MTDHIPRPLIAASLPVAILETINRWFKANGRMPEQQRIISALTALMADQVLQNPDGHVQAKTIETVMVLLVEGVNAENRRRRATEPSTARN